MNILLTGASSFTGVWFAQALVRAGHSVMATMQRPRASYEGTRAARVRLVDAACETVFDCPFGGPRFLEVVDAQSSWDVLCHHAAQVTGYQSADFDVLGAVRQNTEHLREMLALLAQRGGRAVVFTGSVFEPDEGAGEDVWRAFSPYGLSKKLSGECIRYEADAAGLASGKFVIANPFGPYEEPRYTAYLMRSWLEGKTPAVKTPAYVRDNIHVDLLARCYALFVERIAVSSGFQKLAPSGYAESQGEFSLRVAREMQPRLGLPCALELQEQTDFSQPRVRVNPDHMNHASLGFREEEAWDQLADYYRGNPAK